MERRVTRSMGFCLFQETLPAPRRNRARPKAFDVSRAVIPMSAHEHVNKLEKSIRENKVQKKRANVPKLYLSEETLQTIGQNIPALPQALWSPVPPLIIEHDDVPFKIDSAEHDNPNLQKSNISTTPKKDTKNDTSPTSPSPFVPEKQKTMDILPIQKECDQRNHSCHKIPISVLISLEQQYNFRDSNIESIHRLTHLILMTRSGYCLPRRAVFSIILDMLQSEDVNWSARIFCFLKGYFENHPIETCVESREIVLHWSDSNNRRSKGRQESSPDSWSSPSNDELCIRGVFIIFLGLCEQGKNASQCEFFLDLFVDIMTQCKINRLEDEGDQSFIRAFMTTDGDDRLIETLELILKSFPMMSLRLCEMIQRVVEMIYEIHTDLVDIFNQKMRYFLRHCDFSVFVRFMESIHNEAFRVYIFHQFTKESEHRNQGPRIFTLGLFMEMFGHRAADQLGSSGIPRLIEAQEWCSRHLHEPTEREKEKDYPRFKESIASWMGEWKTLISWMSDLQSRINLERMLDEIGRRLFALIGIVVV